MLDPHIVKSYDEQLKKLYDLVRDMGTVTMRQLDLALQCLAQPDPALARQAETGDLEADDLERAIGEQVVRLLALRAPVADDLRVVVSALKIASALERSSDYAKGMARRSLALRGQQNIHSVRGLLRMGNDVNHLLSEVMAAYETADTARALQVRDNDRAIDELYSSLFRELLTYMMEDTRNVATCSHLLFIAKNIERIGDLSTNVAEMVHFCVTGEDIGSQRPKGDTSYGMPV